MSGVLRPPRGGAERRASRARLVAFALPALLCLAPAARGVTFAFQDYTCPIDGKPFTQGLPTAGHPLGSQLDLKPWGPVLAPSVLPVCPDNRFVLWKHEFTDAELVRLRALLASPDWLAIRDADTDYFRVARLRQWLGDDAVDIAFTYLYATWEVDETPDRYARYAEIALDAVERALRVADARGDERAPTLRLVALELERRLGRFDAARERATHMAAESAFSDGTPHAVLSQQQSLIAARDAAPHRMVLGSPPSSAPTTATISNPNANGKGTENTVPASTASGSTAR